MKTPKPQTLRLSFGIHLWQGRRLEQVEQVVGYHLQSEPGRVGPVLPAEVYSSSQPALEDVTHMFDSAGLAPMPSQLSLSLHLPDVADYG